MFGGPTLEPSRPLRFHNGNGPSANVHASNPYGLTALMRAISRNPEPPIVLEMLIQHGADVNAADKQGRTVLAFAREQNNKAAIEVLTSSGAKN